MVVARHHVFGTEVHKWHQVNAVYLLDIPLVAFGDRMNQGITTGA